MNKLLTVTTAVISLIICNSSANAQSHKWRIGGEWVTKDLKRFNPNTTSVGVGLTIERQWRSDSAFKIAAGVSYVHLYGSSSKVPDVLYEINLPVVYARGGYMINKKIDLNISAGSTNLGSFIAPGIGEQWKSFHFNMNYRINVLTYKKGDYYDFKNHISASILYSFIKN